MTINMNSLLTQNNAYIPPQSKNNVPQLPQDGTLLQTGETGECYISRLPLEVLEELLHVTLDSMVPYKTIQELCLLKFVNRAFREILDRLLREGGDYDIKSHQKLGDKAIREVICRSSSDQDLNGMDSMFAMLKMALKNIRHLEVNLGNGGFQGEYYLNYQYANIDTIFSFLDAVAQHGKFKSLCIGIEGIDDVHFNTIIEKVVNIIERHPDTAVINLRFSHRKFNWEIIEILGENLQKNIYKLLLNGSEIGVNGVQRLAPYFQNTSIFSLRLDKANIGNEGLRLLAENLPAGKLPETLELLSLAKNDIDHEGLPYLNKILPNNIKGINLSKNNIDNKGMSHIVDLLRNKGIRNLNLSVNKITFEKGGSEVLIAALPKTKIRSLNLESNSETNNQIKNGEIKNKNGKKVEIIVSLRNHQPSIELHDKMRKMYA